MRIWKNSAWKAALLGLAAWAAASLQPAKADFVFNPTGGGAVGAIALTGFDPAPGDALAQGAVPAIANAIANGGGDVAGNQFKLYYQATTSALIDPNGNPLTPPGLNSTYQITYTAVINEYVASVSGNQANFGISANQTGAFLHIYQNNGAPTTNALLGTGFTDGTLILSATPIPSTTGGGNFTNTGAAGNLDQHGANDWVGTTTVGGFGASALRFNNVTDNPSYFISPPPSTISLSFTTTNTLPFTLVDPSRSFFGAAVSTVGSVNGTSGPDVLFQADGNVSVVPEPSSLVLSGLGLGGVFLGVLRRRARPS